jgi:hypothetical protein
MKTVMQVLVGLALCAAIAYVLIYHHSNMPCFWEVEDPSDPGVYSITWRSYTMLTVLLALHRSFRSRFSAFSLAGECLHPHTEVFIG